MKKKRRAFTLIELLVVVAIIALLISILLPSLSRARELSKRLVCQANLKGIGTSCKTYANSYMIETQMAKDDWPIVPFDETEIDEGGIEYLTNPSSIGEGNTDLPREDISCTDGDQNPHCTQASDHISPTRCWWLLVRSGDVTVKQFICPSSDDIPDDTQEVDRYYDFRSIVNISYGYQVPWGPGDTRASESADSRLAVAADKGPFDLERTPALDPLSLGLTLTSAPNQWKKLNSSNHGGRGSGEGQNVLFQDGHANFERKPAVGIDNDNIYTLMNDDATEEGRHFGMNPWSAPTNPYPGEDTFNGEERAISDSLIWP
jgi:prepilin-type N-terminal cleavage/methylation domain-containing protein